MWLFKLFSSTGVHSFLQNHQDEETIVIPQRDETNCRWRRIRYNCKRMEMQIHIRWKQSKPCRLSNGSGKHR